jgi:hypothetical protein
MASVALRPNATGSLDDIWPVFFTGTPSYAAGREPGKRAIVAEADWAVDDFSHIFLRKGGKWIGRSMDARCAGQYDEREVVMVSRGRRLRPGDRHSGEM